MSSQPPPRKRLNMGSDKDSCGRDNLKTRRKKSTLDALPSSTLNALPSSTLNALPSSTLDALPSSTLDALPSSTSRFKFSAREDLRATCTPTSSRPSTLPFEPSSVSISSASTRAVNESDGVVDGALFDGTAHLESYDRELNSMSQPFDVEESDMLEADARRHARVEGGGDVRDATFDEDVEEYWNSNFKTAVHEAGRRLFAQSFTRGRHIDESIATCFSSNEQQICAILADFGAPVALNISYKHVMGEALELMVCYLSKVQKTVHMRDYLAERRRGNMPSEDERAAIFVECEVYKCFMSSAPRRSPFHMTRKDRDQLADAFGGSPAAERLADKLFDQSMRDRFFDVLVILKDIDNDGRYHIRAIQCKARTHFEAYVDISKYVGHQFATAIVAEELDVLVRLDWVSNVFSCKQTEGNEDFASLRENGRLNVFLYEEIIRTEDDIRLAAAMASHPFGSSEAEIVPERPRKQPRACQREALEVLRRARDEQKMQGVSVVCATGAGKSLIAFMDVIATLYDANGNVRSDSTDQIPLIWMCPRILLLEQSAEGFRMWEQDELRRFTRTRNGTAHKPLYYVVCSQKDDDLKEVAPPSSIRRINCTQLCQKLLEHAARGELTRCRFFTTIEGGGSFWYQLYKFIRLSRGIAEPLECQSTPIVRAFVVDEAHTVVGNSASRNQLALSVPCAWRVCYTATPEIEKSRARMIDKMCERMTGSNEGELNDGEAFEDTSPRVTTPEEMFPDEYYHVIERATDADPMDELIESKGLSGIQLFSDNLEFVSIRDAPFHPYFQTREAQELLLHLHRVMELHPTGPGVDHFKTMLGNRQVIIYPTRKAYRRGACTCHVQSAPERSVDVACAEWCASKVFTPEVIAHDRYTPLFDFWSRNFVASDAPTTSGAKTEKMAPDCVVLGWDNTNKVLSIRDGAPRGIRCHDFSGFGVREGRNAIGPPVFRYSFAEAFRSPDNILARPILLTYQLKIQDDSVAKERLQAIFGIDLKKFKRGPPRMKSTRLDKVGLQIAFECTERPIGVTTQDYATVMIIYKMIERREASKIMVFCGVNEECRRCLALFNLVIRTRAEEARSRGEVGRANLLDVAHGAHIYASWDREGREQMTDKMPENARRQMLHRFRTGEIEVLFNVDYLSTGIDIPCTDAVVLAKPPSSTRTLLQRWGRALRSVSERPGKRGILALVSSNPLERDGESRTRRQRMGIDPDSAFDFGGPEVKQFQHMYRVAVCAAHPSNRILGQEFTYSEGSLTKPKKTSQKLSTLVDGKQTPKRGAIPTQCHTVHHNVERSLCRMFDIVLRDLINDQ